VNRRAAIVVGAILAGALQALLPELPGGLALAAVVLVPLLVAIDGASARESIAAAIAYAVALAEVAVLPWLAPALAAYFELSWTRALVLAASTLGLLGGLHGAILGVALALRPRRAGPFLVLWYAALWASWEALRTLVPPGFPAAVLGASLDRAPALLQVASLTGIAGVTAVVVAANAGIAALWSRDTTRRSRWSACATGVGLACIAAGWGAIRSTATPTPSADAPVVLAVDLVATDVDASTLDAFIAATPIDRRPRPDFIVWPESALNVDLARDRAAWRKLSDFVDRGGATLLTGGLSLEIGPDGRSERFNSLHVMRPLHGMRSYHKRLLVPLAESWPPIFGAPPASIEPISAGRELPLLRAAGTTFGALICFEIADAASARALARNGASFLLNVTNDVWFRGTDAPHLRWARIRAIESGRPVVRVANAGVSAIFDPLGGTVAMSHPTAPVGVLEGLIPPAIDTVYGATGEVFLPACLGFVAVGAAASLLGIMAPRRTRSRSCPV
jgi:apolipoprotein N-acyltransferase